MANNRGNDVQIIDDLGTGRSSGRPSSRTNPSRIHIPGPGRNINVQQHVCDSSPSPNANTALKSCLNLTKDIVELQNSKASLAGQLASEREKNRLLTTQVQNVTQTLEQQKQQNTLLQSEHEEALNASKNQADVATLESKSWMDKYMKMNQQYLNLKQKEREMKTQLKKEINLKESMDNSCQHFKQKFQGKLEEVEILQKKLKVKCEDFDKVSAELADAIKSNKIQEVRHSQTILENERKHTATILELVKDKEELQSTVNEQKATISSNSVQLAKLSTDLEKAEEDRQYKASELAKAEKRLTEANNEISQLKSRNKSLTTKLNKIFQEEREKQLFESNSALHKLWRENREKVATCSKRGNSDGGGGSSTKKPKDPIPLLHDSDDDDERIDENGQVNERNPIDAIPPDHNDVHGQILNSPSSSNGSPSPGIRERGSRQCLL